MEPDDAAEAMRSEAEHMMRMIRMIRARESETFSKNDLLNWLCMAFQQHADFKMSMADVVESMGRMYPGFQLMPISTQITYQQSEDSRITNIEAPPFDSSFWMGLGDV